MYIASALIEYHCYNDPAALKIFERGIKLFPQDEDFALAYLQHLINTNDLTNARACFETFVSKAPRDKTRRIYRVFTDYETHYGELAQVQKLERRMAELYPEDPKLDLFNQRYTYQGVNPSTFVPILSNHQIHPRNMYQQQPPILPIPPIPTSMPGTTLPLPPPPPPGLPPIPLPIPGRFNTPLPPMPPPPPPPPVNRVASPKRQLDDHEDFNTRARKLPRADSPLKGAAGRRLNQLKQQAAKRQQQMQQPVLHQPSAPQQPVLPEAVWGLLSILPPAERYTAVRFSPEAMVKFSDGHKGHLVGKRATTNSQANRLWHCGCALFSHCKGIH